MASPRRTPQELLARLEGRHDELLSRLDDLNAQILAALEELAPKRPVDTAVEASRGEALELDAAATR